MGIEEFGTEQKVSMKMDFFFDSVQSKKVEGLFWLDHGVWDYAEWVDLFITNVKPQILCCFKKFVSEKYVGKRIISDLEMPHKLFWFENGGVGITVQVFAYVG
jgi:hypothetical protein